MTSSNEPHLADRTPVDEPSFDPSGSAASEGPGAIIGRYKLLQQIGEGGFGSVFMAEQREPIVRKVALKVIKLGMQSRQVVARFEAERQALALMDHPHIAKVLDAGTTDTGRPFFVMELCTGLRITEYADEHKLTVRERLELFVQICQAVQHAHQKGIIHRDLKPSNVLVHTQDGQPHAKVIDFGIAKATAARLTDRTLFTEHKQLIGTPEYMSPEQASGSLDIDTRTDVYSLGVMLYELLTGATPFDARSLRVAAYDELVRIIREVDPPKPSTRLRNSAAILASAAARRRIEPSRLAGIIRGDLDWIAMKCLDKDRSRRYETAKDLASDIQRHLDGGAVLAAPPGAGYRVRKFVRRHRRGVAAAVALAVVLTLGVTGTTAGMLRATRANERLHQANRDLSQTNVEVDRALAEVRAAGVRADAEAKWNFRMATVLANAFQSPEGLNQFAREWESQIQELSIRLPVDHPDLIRQRSLYAVWRWSLLWSTMAAAPGDTATPEFRTKLKQSGALIEHAYASLRGHCEPQEPLWSAVVNDQIQWTLTERGEAPRLFFAVRGGLSAGTCEQVAPLYDDLVVSFSSLYGPLSASALRMAGERVWLHLRAGNSAAAAIALREYLDRRRKGGTPSVILDAEHEHILEELRGRDLDANLTGELFWRYYTDCLPLYSRGSPPYNIGRHTYMRHLAKQKQVYIADDMTDALSYHLAGVALDAGAGSVAVSFIEPLDKRLSVELEQCHPHLLAVKRMHAKALLAADRLQDAESVITAYLNQTTDALGEGHSLTILGVMLRARLLEQQGSVDGARSTYSEACRLARSVANAPRTVLREVLAAAISFERRSVAQDRLNELSKELSEFERESQRTPRNLGFEEGDTSAPADGWFGVPPIDTASEWSEFAYITDVGARAGRRCAILSALRGTSAVTGNSARSLVQSFDAVPYRGRRIRYSAAVRVECEPEGDGAQLWLRVGEESVGTDLSSRADNQTIRAADWQRYERSQDVGKDADRISIGINVFGDATAWIDDVRIELVGK